MTVDSSLLQSRALRFGSVAVRCALPTAQPNNDHTYVRMMMIDGLYSQNGAKVKNILGRSAVLRRRFVL
jgi:hypothetical protein